MKKNSCYKIDHCWEHAVQHRELYLMHCGDLNGEGSRGREGIYVYIWKEMALLQYSAWRIQGQGNRLATAVHRRFAKESNTTEQLSTQTPKYMCMC